jgi:DNA-binding NarL/FixJ family response regulator
LAVMIAAGEPEERIGRALQELGMEVDALAEMDQLLDGAELSELSLIVLSTAGEETAPASLVARLARRAGDVPIVLVCPAIERWDVRAALAAGAAGIVLDRDDDALKTCLAAARAGQACVPRRHARQIDPPALSTREKQILGLLVMGYMNSQIAERLFLAESTVKSHLSSAFGKLGVRSRNQAVDLILDPEQGLGMGILGLVGERLDERGA